VDSRCSINISIIGPGRVGTAIGVLAARAGLCVAAVAGRSRRRAKAAAARIGRRTQALSPAGAAAAGELVLLTVPDDAIAPLCGRLARAKAFRCGAVVAHCSGALSSEVLLPAVEACECRIGSMHPLQTFPTWQAAVKAMGGTCCFIEGDRLAVASLKRLASAIGGVPVRIEPQAKALYHAAAVVACNDLVALLDAAVAIGQAAGISQRRGLAALEPLVRATVDNVFAMGPAKALTGPVARGDLQTVRRHLAALRRAAPQLVRLYAALAEHAARLAVRKGTLSQPAATRLIAAVAPAGRSRPTKPKRKENP